MSVLPATPCSVLLSGGVDSAVLAALMVERGSPVDGTWVDYGQPAAEAEERASRAIAAAYGLSWKSFVVRGHSLRHVGEIPGRNDLLVSAARMFCSAPIIAIGIHAGTPYADCTTQWLQAWTALLDTQYHGVRQLVAPLLGMNKSDIYTLVRKMDVPVDLTYSCENASTSCGQCLSCKDRESLTC